MARQGNMFILEKFLSNNQLPKAQLAGTVKKWLGNTLTPEGYVTSTTKGGNRISFTGNQRADDWINKQIDSGKFGFDPTTGGTFPLKKPVQGLSKEDQFIGSEAYYNLQAPEGFNTESQRAQIKNLPEFQQDIINAENKKRREKWIINSDKEIAKNPLFYLPGAIATGGLGLLGLEAAGAAAAPYITSALATQLPGMAAVPGATVGNAITAGFAGHGLTHVAPDAVEMYKNPTWGNAGSLAMDALEVAPIVGPAGKMMGEGISTAGKMLGTEEGLLSNAYKLNSNAERLNNANKSYRVTGLDALEDFQNTGVLRSVQQGAPEGASLTERAMSRPTGFPSFQKGFADMRYAPEEGAAIFETALPTFKRGEINPVTGFPIKGRHYAHRVINPETGRAVAEIPASDVKVFGDKPHWWKGYQEVDVSDVNKLQQSADNTLAPIREANVSVTENIAPTPWQMQDVPGLHLQSTMDNGAISRIVEPKTGLINTEQALAIIGKESGGADKVAIIKQGLGENIPKKMDYNDFRKVVQDQIIPLETNLVEHSSNYGLGSLGYPSPKISSYEAAIKNTDESINNAKKYLKENNIKQLEYEFKPVYEVTDSNGYKQVFPTMDEAVAAQKQSIEVANKNIESMTANRANTLEQMKSLPLENKTIIFGNKEKFGKGSNAHHNPDETLGHAHYLIDAETPDILTVTQLQSDAFQGTHRIMPKTFDPERAKYAAGRMTEIQERNKSVLNKMITEGVDETGRPVVDYEIKQMQEIVDAQELQNALQKGHVENFAQKSLLDKNHQERYLQEIVNHAAQRGDVNKIRVPTFETAANVQGYVKQNLLPSDITSVLKSNKIHVPSGTSKETLINDLQELLNNSDNANLSNIKNKIANTPEEKLYSLRYDDESQTILKKYSEQPKLIKKLFGKEPTLVTDSKGNTWYEFDIPESFKQGKGQIKAFKQGGDLSSPYNDMTGFDRMAIQELGGMLYANVDNKLPHEQSMAKYLGPGKSVLDFMHRKVVGGPVPFNEYYRENIINPRNKL